VAEEFVVSEDHNVKIDGKRWLLRFTRLKGDAAGWTFFDNAKRPRILIDEKLKGGERLETILHELAHAVLGPTISEESITELAKVQRRVLTMLNFKEVKDAEG
jgi:Zn-dependent peptidase ImmA (M78 family)